MAKTISLLWKLSYTCCFATFAPFQRKYFFYFQKCPNICNTKTQGERKKVYLTNTNLYWSDIISFFPHGHWLRNVFLGTFQQIFDPCRVSVRKYFLLYFLQIFDLSRVLVDNLTTLLLNAFDPSFNFLQYLLTEILSEISDKLATTFSSHSVHQLH